MMQNVLEHIPFITISHGLDFKINWANRVCRKFAGFSSASISEKKCFMVWGLVGPCAGCPLQQVIETGRPGEIELPRPDQAHWPETQGFWSVNIVPVTDDRRHLIGVIETACEITSEKKAQYALRQSESLLRQAQHLAHIGHWELDLKTDHLTWSDEIFRIFEIDYCKFGASYETFLNATHPEDREMVNRAYTESVQSRTPYIIEHRLQFPDDRIKYVQERCETFYDDDGTPLRSLGTVQDITGNKLIEDENKRLQAQFVQAQKMESVGRLAGGVAHDFNNMLCVIMGHLDLAFIDMNDNSPIHTTLTEIKNAAQRSAALTRQLLGFARQQPIVPIILNMNYTIDNMLKLLRRLIGDNIELKWIPGADLGRIKIDPAQVDQILANLCVNARDAISEVGTITIETQNIFFDESYCEEHPGFQAGTYVMLAVSDNGIGMEKITMARLFEPFYTTKKMGEGTGLGLATIYGIVKQNNGFINVYSEPGKGSTFRIYMPCHEGDEERKQEIKVCATPMGGNESILLIEDEMMILNFCRKILEKYGYRVLSANTPEEALTLIEKHTGLIDLLVTDIVMPGMSGKDIAAKVSASFPDVKTLYMSGYTANVIADHGLLYAGINFLQKPFSAIALAEKVRTTLTQ